ncbi:hypothetical protein [Hymenobacter sp. UYP22]|uniref:hypothetical protein n=1 Tax=Hymenobacter sp. UYP22 TaxID=3156348 RepID=UPI0033997290
MIIDNELNRIENLVSHFENRKKQASERLKEEKGEYWYFGIIGFVSEDSVLEIKPIARIQKINSPAGEVELASALKDKSLFGRFRLAVSIASILEERGIERKNLYKIVKKMYDVRSNAVHGSPLGKVKIEDHIADTKMLLSKLLCRFVERGELMNEEQIDDLIFG